MYRAMKCRALNLRDTTGLARWSGFTPRTDGHARFAACQAIAEGDRAPDKQCETERGSNPEHCTQNEGQK